MEAVGHALTFPSIAVEGGRVDAHVAQLGGVLVAAQLESLGPLALLRCPSAILFCPLALVVRRLLGLLGPPALDLDPLPLLFGLFFERRQEVPLGVETAQPGEGGAV